MAKTILLADDSVTIQKVVDLTFMDEDYEVVAVSDGKEAIRRAGEISPDLVIADVHMPGADGYEVCRQVKASAPGTPVLLLVGTFEAFDEATASEAGADGHLKKPFDSQDLLRRVEELVSAAGSGGSAQAPQEAQQLADLDDDIFEEPEAMPDLAAAAEPVAETTEPVSPEPGGPVGFQMVDAPEEDALPELPALDDEDEGDPDLDTQQQAALEVPAISPEEPESEPAAAELASPELAESEPADAEPTDTEPPAPPPVAAPPVAPPPADAAASGSNGHSPLSEEDLERVARRVAELVAEKVLRDVAWEVVPDLAEVVIRERIQELESETE